MKGKLLELVEEKRIRVERQKLDYSTWINYNNRDEGGERKGEGEEERREREEKEKWSVS